MTFEISYSAAAKDFRSGQYTASLVKLNKLLEVQKDGRTYALLARTLNALGMPDDAAAAYQLAAQQSDKSRDEYLKEALNLYFKAGSHDQALSVGNQLMHLARKDADIAFVLASILIKRGENKLAGVFKKVLASSRNIAHASLAGNLLVLDWDFDKPEQTETMRILLAKYPHAHDLRIPYLLVSREHCDFDPVDRHQPIVDRAIANGDFSMLRNDVAFYNLHWTTDESINRRATFSTPIMPEGIRERRRALPHAWGKKIRLGYVSSDLWETHATMKLVRRVFETHDRDRFEVFLFDHTPVDRLAVNKTDRGDWGTIINIGEMTDDQAAEEIRRLNIDILIDLKGHTRGGRMGIFNSAAAPIQASWLGFPGSALNTDIDYIIGDHFVLPDSSKPHYHEKFCRLPETYQPNDSFHRPLPIPTPRAELGLPDDAFVFCSFNANRKLNPALIDLWAEIMRRAENAVLWIMAAHSYAPANILKRFEKLKVSPKRIIMTRGIEYTQHLNRLPAADLALDTFPVNGHTTTAEALWAGVPVLTVKGGNFASRVSESLLNAIDMPDLVMDDGRAYVEKAVSLASDPEMLNGLKQRLADNRFRKPLFDPDRFREHLEMAFVKMVDHAKAGSEPDHFDVPMLPPRSEKFDAR